MEKDNKKIDFKSTNIQIQTVIETTILEINKTTINVSETAILKINEMLIKISDEKIKVIEKILMRINNTNEIIQICIKSLDKIFKDDKVGMDDMPTFVEMIVDIVNKLKERDISEDIKDVVDLCEFICQIVITCIDKIKDTEVFLKVLSSSIFLLKFDLNPKKFLPCCC